MFITKLEDEKCVNLMEGIQKNSPSFITDEDEITLYALIKTVVDEVWYEYNRNESQTIGKS